MEHYRLDKLIGYFGIDIQSLPIGQVSFDDLKINQLRLDSRAIGKNDVFIALQGALHHGKAFIPQAIESGAIAVIIDAESESDDKTVSLFMSANGAIPQIHVYQLASKLSGLANDFYHNPSDKLCVVGVTGTNGKTTVTQLIAQWIMLLGKKSAVLGTVGNGLYNQLMPSTNTTPSSLDIQSYLADFAQQEAALVAMEVSSHGLALNRVKDVSFAATVFTNLSRDHLDFHGSMENYKHVKWSLFADDNNERAVVKSGKKIINFDDITGREWIEKLNDDVVVVSTDSHNLSTIKQLNKPYICVTNLNYHDRGVSIRFDSSWGSAELESRLFGAFNVSNLLLAFATLVALDFPFYALTSTTPHLVPVCGRMEIFANKEKPTVIVDYAHTPDALDKALTAIKAHCKGKVWVIFGCGGDRDSGKRPLMAEIAEKHTKNIIVTNDNPRTENAEKIVDDIIKGFQSQKQVQIILDRENAIKAAIKQSDENDIILVAGKGHEDYQIIGKKKLHYSDRETAAKLLGGKL